MYIEVILKINIRIILKKISRSWRIVDSQISFYFTKYIFFIYEVDHSSFKTNGRPIVSSDSRSKIYLGRGLKMNNGVWYNIIGRQQPCMFVANCGGVIKIGSNLQISSSALHSNKLIEIGDNVLIGGGCVIFDTDFHSLNFKHRSNTKLDINNTKSAPVIIGSNVFIGAFSTILKGVEIGDNSIIAAGSLVSKKIPSNQIWGGNPAKFIKNI